MKNITFSLLFVTTRRCCKLMWFLVLNLLVHTIQAQVYTLKVEPQEIDELLSLKTPIQIPTFELDGFSEAEINNSLEYLLPQIEITADMPYYYLTVLDEEAIAKVSTITVTPEPSTVLRQYFAVYPTMTPVQASGEFTFASPKETASGFVVKETGELLLDGTVFVTFK